MKRLIRLAVLTSLLISCGDDLPTAREKLRLSESPLERAAAARRVGELGGEEAVRVLTLHGLRDDSGLVRTASVEALAPVHHPRLVDLFGDLLLDPDPDVQAAAADALVKQGGPKAVRYLEVAYSRTGNPGRAICAGALVRLGASPRAAIEKAAQKHLEQTLEALRTGSPAERVGAAEDLGRSGRPEAISALLPLLEHPYGGLAAAAARALGEAGEARAVEPLLALLPKAHPTVQEAAVEALAAIGDPVAVPHLRDAALQGSAAVALSAVAALSGFDSPEATQALCEVALGTRSPAVARRAAGSVAARGSACEGAAPRVAESLAQRGSAVLAALAAVEGLGAAAVDEAVSERVLALCRSEDDELGAAALEAAAAAGLKEAADVALGTLERIRAADAAGREEWVAKPLPTMWNWGDEEARREAEAHEEGLEAAQDRVLQGMGLGQQRRYRDRFGDLMGRVAEQRARQEAEARKAAGEEAPDLEKSAARHLKALTTDPPSARIELVEDLPPRSVPVLAAVARAAGGLAGKRAVPPLTELLRHPVDGIRVAAVRGLARVEDASATDALEHALADDQPSEVIDAAVKALGAREGEVEPLLRASRLATGSGQVAIAAALARQRGPEVVRALQAMLDGPAAAQAAAGLVQVEGEGAVAPLLAHLGRRDAPARAEALAALGGLGVRTPDVVTELRRSLHSERPEVRATAARILRTLNVDDPWLEALRGDYDRQVRVAAGYVAGN